MDGADPSELARRDDLIRRQMAERTERQGWVHHVVDGGTGEVLTTPLDRPLAPLSRASGWPGSAAGPLCRAPGDRSTSSLRGTPTRPRRLIGWPSTTWPSLCPTRRTTSLGRFLRIPSPPTIRRGFSAHFSEPPSQRCVLTLVFAASAWDGAVGHISFVGTVNADIPIAGGWANHTVDISTVPPADGVHTWANLRPGLHRVDFNSITLQAERVILDPTIG